MSIVPHGETCAAFCFLPLLLMAVSSLRLQHRHLIVALHRRPAVIADALALGAFCFAVNHASNGGGLRCAPLRASLAGSTLV